MSGLSFKAHETVFIVNPVFCEISFKVIFLFLIDIYPLFLFSIYVSSASKFVQTLSSAPNSFSVFDLYSFCYSFQLDHLFPRVESMIQIVIPVRDIRNTIAKKVSILARDA